MANVRFGVVAWCLLACCCDAGNLRIDRNAGENTYVQYDFEITPDGNRVVYRQRKNADGLDRIYTVPITGGDSTDLTLDLPEMGGVDQTIRLSPDSNFVVYTKLPVGARRGARRGARVISATLDGQNKWALSDFPQGEVNRDLIRISPQSTHVLFVGKPRTGVTYDQLHSAPLNGETPAIQITPKTTTHSSTNNSFIFVGDGDRVVHTMPPRSNRKQQAIWTLSIDGSEQIELATQITSERDIATSGFLPTADGENALIYAHFNGGSGEWFNVPVDGSPISLLTEPEFDLDALNGQLSPDGSHFIVRQRRFGSPNVQLWSYPVAGGPARVIVSEDAGIGSPTLIKVSDVNNRMVFSTGDSRAIYSVAEQTGDLIPLVERDGFDPHNEPMFDLTPDGGRIVFKADFDRDEIYNLYSVSTDGGEFTQLNDESPEYGVITNYWITPDGKRVVYTANYEGTQRLDAYSVPIEGGESQIISGYLEGELSNFGNPLQISPDSKRALFIVTNRQTDSYELYSSPIVRGDVTFDGQLDAGDIDLVTRQLHDGSASSLIDIDDSRIVNADDREFLIAELLNSEIGDSDLNGIFDSSDLVLIFKANKYEDGIAENAGWADGDWNGDLEFDSGDLVAAFKNGNYEPSAMPLVQQIPEPRHSVELLLVAIAIAARRCRRIR